MIKDSYCTSLGYTKKKMLSVTGVLTCHKDVRVQSLIQGRIKLYTEDSTSPIFLFQIHGKG